MLAPHIADMMVLPMPTGRTDMDRAGKGRNGIVALQKVGKLVLWLKKTCESHLFLVASEPERTARSAGERTVKIE